MQVLARKQKGPASGEEGGWLDMCVMVVTELRLKNKWYSNITDSMNVSYYTMATRHHQTPYAPLLLTVCMAHTVAYVHSK